MTGKDFVNLTLKSNLRYLLWWALEAQVESSCSVGSYACHCHENHSSTPYSASWGFSTKCSSVTSTQMALHACAASALQAVAGSCSNLGKCPPAPRGKSCIYPAGDFMATLIVKSKIMHISVSHSYLQRCLRWFKNTNYDPCSKQHIPRRNSQIRIICVFTYPRKLLTEGFINTASRECKNMVIVTVN